ncbi:HdeD family acid-resistance protein [Wenxinia saemankumensis]|uniref:Uncharacterized membrane protein HdeD, DUF308 family n=1 Tax=Wenxinia saemankumensis TaxID=1447782 RepID=A0A1M6H0T7_9RHOB|nr:DUF308 domain-containing protein [Wenxinia saemankumensis]SHJ15752.1 Uncharacterized membrane protein HdeD, DUF308 family [Wenxinia saemankumensis]
MSDPGPGIPEPLRSAVQEHRGRFTFLGWALIAIGVLAVLFPLVSSIAVKVLVGWLLVLSGAAVLYHAFQSRSWGSALWSGLVGVLQIAAGIFLVVTLDGLIGLTLLMAILFAAQGALEIALWAQNHGTAPASRWMLVSGAASILLGLLLLLGLPGTALWALGLMLGLNLITSGVAFLALTRA